MALLAGGADGRRLGLRGVNAALATLIAISITGCVLFEALGLREKPLAFSHERHLQEGLGCSDCHSTYEADDVALSVKPAQCALCHADLDAEKPPERQVASLFDGENFKAAHVTAFSDEVKFSHATHVASGASCESCHAAILTSERVDESVSPRMDACMQCHASVGVATTCDVCHRQMNVDTPPPNHQQQWKVHHGIAVRGDFAGPANDCALCHTEKACATCHQDEPPKNHNNFWRLKGHGVVASIDRDNCAVCHTTTFCDRCHKDTAPLSHDNGTWAAPMDTHCLQCHVPLQDESCFVCHKTTPSHQDAAPKPAVPPHSPAQDCRSCHNNVIAPLPHVDNGDNCNFCHK